MWAVTGPNGRVLVTGELGQVAVFDSQEVADAVAESAKKNNPVVSNYIVVKVKVEAE